MLSICRTGSPKPGYLQFVFFPISENNLIYPIVEEQANLPFESTAILLNIGFV